MNHLPNKKANSKGPSGNNQDKELLVGNRIPRDYFITKGTGESDITIHAGAYHLALQMAGIEKTNILTYSSILPAIAQEIPQPLPSEITHGAVMECIMAAASTQKGERASAGIAYAWLYEKKTDKKYGGLVCEHQGSYSVEVLEKNLKASMEELYHQGFEQDFVLKGLGLVTQSFVPQKKYGTALVALCFTNYVFPILS